MASAFDDFVVIGSGVSGSFLALDLVRSGAKVRVLEAGKRFSAQTFPRREIDANAQLYWAGGVELNRGATLGLLRPKVVGGGSVVNQALLDRFDEAAWGPWRDASGIEWLNGNAMEPYYLAALDEIEVRKLKSEDRNGNAQIFAEGFERKDFRYEELTRAQRDCRFSEGNDCIACLAGCVIESKQSMPFTTLREGERLGLVVEEGFEALAITQEKGKITVHGIDRYGNRCVRRARRLVLAAGAIGNSVLLLRSGLEKKLPTLGKGFYCHPQYMVLALYPKKIRAHRGPLQTYKSNDPGFRKAGFKLENVFAPPVGIAMLVPDLGRAHAEVMARYDEMACIEVAIRDTEPGRILMAGGGSRHGVQKRLSTEDKRRRNAGLKAVREIFEATRAERIIEGAFPIGLHLMGGLALGTDSARSVVSPDFSLHGFPDVFCADSSVFPNAPGINPSMTIMALAKRAAAEILRRVGASR